jgi:hypothetical protein
VAAEEISKADVISKFQELQQQSQAIQLLDSKLKSLQFSPVTAPAGYWGQTATYEGTVEGSTQSIVGAVYIHDYVNQNSKDGVALGPVTLTSSSGATHTYVFYLSRPMAIPPKLRNMRSSIMRSRCSTVCIHASRDSFRAWAPHARQRLSLA